MGGSYELPPIFKGVHHIDKLTRKEADLPAVDRERTLILILQ
jgi:hypothetical protein